ncbi:UNVERIFIED_CONTAM: hypothetical protein K2H54_041708 [Gekko kuhli]
MVSFIPVHFGKGVTTRRKDRDWGRSLGDSTQVTWMMPGSWRQANVDNPRLSLGSIEPTLSKPFVFHSRSLVSPGRDLDGSLDSLELDCRTMVRDGRKNPGTTPSQDESNPAKGLGLGAMDETRAVSKMWRTKPFRGASTSELDNINVLILI